MTRLLFSLCVLALLALPAGGQLVTIRGSVVRAPDSSPLEGATVAIPGTPLAASTRAGGRFVLAGVPAGSHRFRITAIGFAPMERELFVNSPGISAVVFELTPATVVLADLTVTAVSRAPERIVSAPGAVATLEPVVARDLAITGQPALALTTLPGVDVVQSDVQDFNINARGFNTVFNRRVLVLQDGRDLAIAFLGSQEWLGMSATMEDMAKVEFVRGPSAALYGANAFSGVLAMTAPNARETPGTRLSLSGGGLGTRRADFRHGAGFGNGRWAYRLLGGVSESDAWARSRTNIGDLAREYSEAVDTAANGIVHPFPGYELRPLNGQSKLVPGNLPSAVIGTPDPVRGTYGAARLDYYVRDGSVATVEGGYARTANEVLLGSAARFQITRSTRPWLRAAFASERFHLMAYFSGRDGADQYNLGAGSASVDRSHTLHLEGQYNRSFAGERGRIVLGTSLRSASVNTEATLVAAQYDDRTDRFGALFGQAEYGLTRKLKLVVAGRLDASNLFDAQLSPKAALVYSPSSEQSFRLSVGHAFEMPNTLDYFVSIPAGPAADYRGLETTLRASPLGPALAAVPAGTLFTNSDAVPVLALGNPNLEVEQVTSWEVGYKRGFGRFFLTLEAYRSTMHGFVTDVLPGVNPQYAPWTAPATVPEAARASVATAVREALVAGGQALGARALTRLPDGSTALVLSVGNAGRATVRGVEADLTWRASPAWQFNGNVSFFGFDLQASSFVTGDQVLPNTPARRGNLAMIYRNPRGLVVTASAHFTSSLEWSAGTFTGPVPSSTTVNLTVSHDLTPALRLQGVATNLFNERRYLNLGGAVIGRRMLGGVNVRF